MILFEEAIKILHNNAYVLSTEHVELNKSLGRVLATDIISDINMPPFDKSAMDGFACRKEDLSNELDIIEVISAGMVPRNTIGKNQCSKIMTGGMLPEGANCVVQIENTDIKGEKVILKEVKTSENICYLGEDIKTDDVVLLKGTLLKPQHIAILASVGVSEPEVYKQPVVGVLTTGDEIVEPWDHLDSSQIRNSNGYQIYNQILSMGAIPKYYGIVGDTKEETYARINDNLSKVDVLLITGGVSMGDFDFVPEILKKLKANIHFYKVAIQPGRPMIFAQSGKKFIFGLPGNPVSSFTSFEFFVKQFLYRMMGHEFKPPTIKLPFGTDYTRKKLDRKKLIPIIINEENQLIPLEYHGSAHIFAYEKADGIISLNIGQSSIKKGDLIDVRQI